MSRAQEGKHSEGVEAIVERLFDSTTEYYSIKVEEDVYIGKNILYSTDVKCNLYNTLLLFEYKTNHRSSTESSAKRQLEIAYKDNKNKYEKIVMFYVSGNPLVFRRKYIK